MSRKPPSNTTRPLLRSLSRPHGFEPLRVQGSLPEELRGTLYRAGPGVFERFGQMVAHAVEADGAVTGVRFDGESAFGACRVVESEGYRREEAAGRFLYGSTASFFDRLRSLRAGEAKTTGSTSAFVWQDRLFALMEGGLLQEMCPETLDTRAHTDLGVVRTAFSAHPHRVASLRTTFNFGIRYGRHTEVDLYALPDEGDARLLGTVRAPWATMIHDFVATEKHLLLFIGPVKLNTFRALTGADISRMFEWKPELGSRVMVIPIDAVDQAKTFELDPFWVWHFANAYESADGPVVDMCRYPEFSMEEIGGVEFSGVPPTFTRLRLDPSTGVAREEAILDWFVEFPQVHPRTHGGRHGVVFAQTERRTDAGAEAGVSRIDVENGDASGWVLPARHFPSEPVLVPRGEAEDDVWVLSLVYEAPTDHSYVAVLDGQRLQDGPVATAHFDHPIPATFHGVFSPARG